MSTGGGDGGGSVDEHFGLERLKVLTWNVLCDGLSGSHPEKGGFVRAPEESLEWGNRRQVLGVAGCVSIDRTSRWVVYPSDAPSGPSGKAFLPPG